MTSKQMVEPPMSDSHIDPPPPYKGPTEDEDTSTDSSDDDELDKSLSGVPHARDSGGLPLPVVIPQTTSSWKGAFFSPFVRAYVPELEAHGIERPEFVTFIDGLNECFVAHPVFQGLGIVGQVLTMVYGVQPAQWAGMGLQVAAGVASTATSYARTGAYVKATNKDLFNPAGLHLHVLTTKKMMEKVGYPGDKLQLPPLNWDRDLPGNTEMAPRAAEQTAAVETISQNDPRIRRIQALEGYVMRIDLNVPDAAKPDNLFRKMGAAQAARMERKQNRRMEKRRAKAFKQETKIDKANSKLSRLESKFDATEAELQNHTSSTGQVPGESQAKLEKRQAKLGRKMDKKQAKLNRKIDKKSDKKKGNEKAKVDRKETKTAHKIRWLVVAKREEQEHSDEDSLPNSEDEDEEEEEQVVQS